MKKINISKIYFIASLLISIVLVLVYFSRLSNWTLDYSFNSDILYFPALYNDLFINGNSLSGWSIPGAPGFFPDMTLYFLFMAITGKVTLATMLFETMQFTAIIFLMVYLLKLCKPDLNPNILMFVPLGLILFVLSSIYGGDYLIAFHILSNTYHLGPFVNTLISLILIVKYFKVQKVKYLIMLLLLIFIAIISDKLFLFMFSVPLIIIMLISINSKNFKNHLKIVLYIFLTSAISLFMFRMLRFSGLFHIRTYGASELSMQKIQSSAENFIDFVSFYLDRNVYISMIFILSFVSILILSFVTIKSYLKERAKKDFELSWFLLAFSLVFICVVLLLPILLGDFVGPAKIRYNISSFYMAILILSFAVSKLFRYRIKNNFLQIIIPLPFLVLFICLTLQAFHYKDFIGGLSNYINYYSEQSQAIDFAKDKINLKKGLATYWNAKPAHLFNKTNTNVYTCLPSGYADYYIVGNKQWYYSKDSDTSKVFNFILLGAKEDTAMLYKYYGEPLQIINYKSYNVLLYNDFIFKDSRAPYFLH